MHKCIVLNSNKGDFEFIFQANELEAVSYNLLNFLKELKNIHHFCKILHLKVNILSIYLFSAVDDMETGDWSLLQDI